jgi:hypothetical protein
MPGGFLATVRFEASKPCPPLIKEYTTGIAVCVVSTTPCREPEDRLVAQVYFAESFASRSRYRTNPRYRPSVPRGNIAGSRHSLSLMSHDTEALWREPQKHALGTAGSSRHNGTAATAVGPSIKCAERNSLSTKPWIPAVI